MTPAEVKAATDRDDELEARILKVLTDWGMDLDSDPPHSWRCQYDKDYKRPPCTHVDELVTDLVIAVLLADLNAVVARVTYQEADHD